MHPLNRYLLIPASIVCASVAVSLNTAADKPGSSETDEPRLAGVWLLQSGVNQSKPIPEEQTTGTHMIVRADKISVYDNDREEIYGCTYELDATATPHTITMTSTMPDRPISQVLGILKVEGDRLTLCYALPGAERPQKFKSTKAGKSMLFKFERPKTLD